MAIRIGHASIDENGKAKNGKAGDQTSKEVCIRSWYSKPWDFVLRCKDRNKAEIMADQCEKGCANNHIGYDQNQRNTLRTQAQNCGFDLSRISVDCETDCSAFMSVCAECSGIKIPYNGNNAPTTSTMKNAFSSTGMFDVLTDTKYRTSEDYLLRGDILVKSGSHTVMALDDGKLATITTNTVVHDKNLDFIEKMAICCQEAYKTLGKVKPSVIIGMACVESGYGKAGSCNHHSYLGQKVGTGKTATKYWDGKFFNASTGEEYVVGVHTTIKANFRSYNSMQQCVLNCYELLNTYLYDKVKADADYETQMKQIKQCGYMTSSTEVNSVLSIIKKYNLTKYDIVCGDSNYYPTYSGTTSSIVEALKSVGESDTSKEHRTEIAKNNGISDYTGSAIQNTQLLILLKGGKLKK